MDIAGTGALPVPESAVRCPHRHQSGYIPYLKVGELVIYAIKSRQYSGNPVIRSGQYKMTALLKSSSSASSEWILVVDFQGITSIILVSIVIAARGRPCS